MAKDHPFLRIQQKKGNANAYTAVFKIPKTKIYSTQTPATVI